MIRNSLRSLLGELRAVSYRGDRFFCPLCNKEFRKFFPFGTPSRQFAQCPYCRSLERHRLLWLVLQQQWQSKRIISTGSLLHVAPEPILEQKFRTQFNYLSIDLNGKKAMRSMDITRIEFEDASFDAVVCNHVLEHIVDDRKAIAELFRVLKPGGWGMIQVPMKGETTHEDYNVTEPAQREKLFGQHDHVRQYGWDFAKRLEETGFAVQVFRKQDILSENSAERISVACEEAVLLSLKPLEAND